jgi:DNA-binding MarR family transcriptional regulator
MRARRRAAADAQAAPQGRTREIPAGADGGHGAVPGSVPRVQRGLTARVSSAALQGAARLRTLRALDRMRVLRTLDVAVLCYPERAYKAALTAAQRAVRSMVKEGLIKRYRTDRHQTVYALTTRGAQRLQGHGDVDATASVRRVSEMTNPEHRLWAQFLVLAAEARGIQAETEQELMRRLNERIAAGPSTVQGLLSVGLGTAGRRAGRCLRPDALLHEPDGATWIEVDRSKRCSDREAALRALVMAIGARLEDGQVLRRVVVFCATDRIEGRVLALLRGLQQQTAAVALVLGRRALREVTPGLFEVAAARRQTLADGRVFDKTVRAGWVVVQQLPTWLPRVRIDARNMHRVDGWIDDDYLPYRRAGAGAPWPRPESPLLSLPA